MIAQRDPMIDVLAVALISKAVRRFRSRACPMFLLPSRADDGALFNQPHVLPHFDGGARAARQDTRGDSQAACSFDFLDVFEGFNCIYGAV